MRSTMSISYLILRACEPIGALVRAEGDRAAARGWRGGRMRRLHGSLSGCRRLPGVSPPHIFRQGDPALGGVVLGLAVQGSPGGAPLSKTRSGSLVPAAVFVCGDTQFG